jgi:hypothetical protein
MEKTRGRKSRDTVSLREVIAEQASGRKSLSVIFLQRKYQTCNVTVSVHHTVQLTITKMIHWQLQVVFTLEHLCLERSLERQCPRTTERFVSYSRMDIRRS